MAESYVPSKKERDWRSLVRHRASLVRIGVDLNGSEESHPCPSGQVRAEAFLQRPLRLGKAGIEWLGELRIQNPVDQIILETNLRLLKSLEGEIEKMP
ncbi:MAG: hypothetical protein QXI39_04255 [Candidatus Bathyarchaeia archaeon]